jgi:hypothetical protein
MWPSNACSAEARNFDRTVHRDDRRSRLVWCRRCFCEAVDLLSDVRIDRLEARLARIEQAIIRIEERLAVTLPHPATKAELAYKPSWHYNWSVTVQ